MINKAILVGNLGQDPEFRATSGGGAIAQLSVATSERKKDSNGEWANHTEWHKVVCFGKTAEFAQNYLRKGGVVYVEGRLQTRKWQDKQGVDRYTTEVVAEVVKGLTRSEASAAGGGGGQRDTGRQESEPDTGGYDKDDIPF